MTTTTWLTLPEIEHQLCAFITQEFKGHFDPSIKIEFSSRLIEDLHFDSLAFMDLLFRI